MRVGDALDRRIIALAVPAAGSAVLHLIHGAVDMFWVKEIGQDELAALAIGTISVWMFASIAALVGTGLTALVARYVGVGRLDAASYVGAQGIRWSGAIGVVTAFVGYGIAPWIYSASNATQGVAEMGVLYTRIIWGGGALILFQVAADAVFRGRGNTRIPFIGAAAALLLNVGLDPLLIHGWGPVPALGVAGAAWATLAATAIGALIVIASLMRRHWVTRTRPDDERLRLAETTPLGRPRWLGLDPAILRRMTRVGAPVSVSGLVFTGIYLGLQNVAGQIGGTAVQAGLGVGLRGESVSYVLCVGWAAAASALVGQSLGGGDPREASRAAWRATLHGVVLSALWGVVLYVFPEEIAGLLAKGEGQDTAAFQYAVDYFRIVAVCLAPQAVELVLDGAFGGAGLTLPPMVISTFFSAIRIPLAWFFAIHLGYGATALWLVITITAILRGLIAGLWFARGTWKTRTV